MQIGSVADWVSGIGSLSAAVVALYVSYSAQRVRLRGNCGIRLLFGGPFAEQVEVFSVSATNISQRPTVVTHIGFSFGILRWKKYGMFLFGESNLGHGVPKPLADGESGSWNAEIGPDSRWLRELAEKFDVTKFHVYTWRIRISTSNGGVTVLRPDKSARQRLLAHIRGSGPVPAKYDDGVTSR